MSALLSRLLILLFIIGWIQYIDHANSNRSGSLAAQDARAFAVSPPKEAAATSIQADLHSIASAAAQCPHAIVPDATPCEAGWVQFVDPVANETGWISMAYLGPADAVGKAPQPPKSAKIKMPKPTHKVAKFKAPKPSKFASITRHIRPTRLPADR